MHMCLFETVASKQCCLNSERFYEATKGLNNAMPERLNPLINPRSWVIKRYALKMTIHHIVLMKYKEGVTDDEKKAWRDGALAMRTKIPQIKEFAVGNKLPHRFDQGWDEAIIMQFTTLEDLRLGFSPHPAHQDFLQFGAQYYSDLLVFDFEI